MCFRSKNKNHIDLIDAEILDLLLDLLWESKQVRDRYQTNLILISSGPIVGEGILQVTCSHTESFDLYRKFHVKISIDQGLGGASLQATSTADMFFLLQVPWIL